MGYKTEINYIVKSSNDSELKDFYNNPVYVKRNELSSDEIKVNLLIERLEIIIEKAEKRVYMQDCPIMFANEKWEILGMCIVDSLSNENGKTKLKCRVIDLYNDDNSKIVSEMIQSGESQMKRIC